MNKEIVSSGIYNLNIVDKTAVQRMFVTETASVTLELEHRQRAV